MKYEYLEKHYPKLNTKGYDPVTDTGFDAEERWEITFYLYHPSIEKVVRQRDKSFNYIKTGKARHKAALKIANKIRQMLDAGAIANESQKKFDGITLIEAMKVALEFKKDRITLDNYEAYISNIRIFEGWLKSIKREKTLLTQADYRLFNDFFEYLRKVRKASNHTFNNYVLHLKALLNHYVQKEKILEKSPLEVKKIRAVSGATHKPFSDEQIIRIKEAIAQKARRLPRYRHLSNYINFIYHLAIRATELRMLRVCDVGQDFITVRAENAKSRHLNHIPLNPFLKEIIDKMGIYEAAKDPKKQNWFVFGAGGEINPGQYQKKYFYGMHSTILRKVGLHQQGYTIYGYKHTKGCHLVQAGATLEDIRLLFRHEDLATTARYLRQIGAIIPSNLEGKSRAL